jgi:hypothetical protein
LRTEQPWDSKAYEALRARVTSGVKPKDVIEELLVQDAVDHAWELFRLRRLKAALLDARLHLGVENILKTLIEDNDEDDPAELAKGLAAQWGSRDPEGRESVEEFLAKAGGTN